MQPNLTFFSLYSFVAPPPPPLFLHFRTCTQGIPTPHTTRVFRVMQNARPAAARGLGLRHASRVLTGLSRGNVCRSAHPRHSTRFVFDILLLFFLISSSFQPSPTFRRYSYTTCHCCVSCSCVYSHEHLTARQVAGTSTCAACPASCAVQSTVVGCPDGVCTQCTRARIDNTCVDSCPPGMFADTSDTSRALHGICTPCHSSCATCWGPTSAQCGACSTGLQYQSACVSQCPPRTYASAGVCYACDSQCLYGCNGSLPTNCTPSSNIGSLLDPSAQVSEMGCQLGGGDV